VNIIFWADELIGVFCHSTNLIY